MEKIISSIPVYNLLTNLIPGTVLAALLKFCVEGCDIFSLTNNIWILAVILYFLGIINSRISSLVFEPLIKMLKIVKFVPHKEYRNDGFLLEQKTGLHVSVMGHKVFVPVDSIPLP